MNSLPTWTVRFAPDNTIINTTQGPDDTFQLAHTYVDWDGTTTVVTVSAHTTTRAHEAAVKALHRYQQDMQDRLNSTRQTVRAA